MFSLIQRRNDSAGRQSNRPWALSALEPRLLLAGDGGAAIASATSNMTDLSGQAVATEHLTSQASIVFVDSDVQDFEQLSDAVLGDSEVVLLSAGSDGLTQITEHLASRRDVHEVHLVGHGDDGRIKLGSRIVDADTLSHRSRQIATWASALEPGADIMVYGCQTGRGSSGATFVNRLARITGADVAASTDVTGGRTVAANWELERVVGDVSASLAFDRATLRSYQHVLPITISAAGTTNDETMLLQIDGSTVATFNNVGGDAYGSVFQNYTYNANGIDADRIRVAFTNAGYDPGNNYDQNLRVDNITVDGVTYETEDPSVFSTGTWLPADGITPGFRQSEFLHDDGYFQYAGATNNGATVVVSAYGDDGRENFELQIDGQTVATYNSIGTSQQDFTYVAPGSVTPEQVRVVFTNDVYDPANGVDYNLQVDKLVIDGETFETESPTVFSSGTWKPADGVTPGFRQSETLHVDGYFQYGSASNGTEIIVSAYGSTGQENFELQIDGTTVASYFAIGTSQQDYSHTFDGSVTPDQVRVVFTNDVYDPVNGIDYNLQVDKIAIDGQEFETEAPTVYSTGSWLPADGIVAGFRQSETLNINGYFQYGGDPGTPNRPTIRINAGGNAYTDGNGNTWQADSFFDGGLSYATTAGIFQTEDDVLYQTERYNADLSYEIPVEDGAYSVNLHFAEIFFEDFGQRRIDFAEVGLQCDGDIC